MSAGNAHHRSGSSAPQSRDPETHLSAQEAPAISQSIGSVDKTLEANYRRTKKDTIDESVPHRGRGYSSLHADMRRSTTPDHSPPRHRKRARKDETSEGYVEAESPVPDGGNLNGASRARLSLPRALNDPGSTFSQLSDTNKSIYLQHQLDQLLRTHQDCHLKRTEAQRREHDLEAKVRASNLYCQQITEAAQADLKGLLDQLSDCKKEFQTLRASMVEQRREHEELERRHSSLQVQHRLALTERDAAQDKVRELQNRLKIAGGSVQAKEDELRTLKMKMEKDQREKEEVRRTGVFALRGKLDAERRIKELEVAVLTLREENTRLAESIKKVKVRRREAQEDLDWSRRARETERLALVAERDQAREEATEARTEVEALRERKAKADRTLELLREGRDIQDVMWVKHCRELRGTTAQGESIKVKEEFAD